MAKEIVRILRDGVEIATGTADAPATVAGISRALVEIPTAGWVAGNYVFTARAAAPGRAESPPSLARSPDILPVHLWADLFSRADGPVGNDWVAINSPIAAISSGDLVRTDAANGFRRLDHLCGGVLPADYAITITVPHSMLSKGMWGIVGRMVGAGGTSGVSGVELIKGTGSVYDFRLQTTIGPPGTSLISGISAPASWSVAQDHTVSLQFSGTTVSVWLDGVQVGTTATIATNATVEGGGLSLVGDSQGDGGYRIRSIIVTDAVQ